MKSTDSNCGSSQFKLEVSNGHRNAAQMLQMDKAGPVLNDWKRGWKRDWKWDLLWPLQSVLAVRRKARQLAWLSNV